MIQLSNEQRQLFAAWCQQEADVCRSVADKMQTIMAHTIADVLTAREMAKAKAFAVVALQLNAELEEVAIHSGAEYEQEHNATKTDATARN